MKLPVILKTWFQRLVFFSVLFSLVGCASTGDVSTIKILMNTTMGEVEMELYQDKAPVSVANFLRYIDAQAFDGGSFYRVVRLDNDNGNPKISVIQGGANAGFKDFPAIKLETTQQTGIKHLDGTLSMARADPDTATSAFFICVGEQPGLDFGATRAKDGLGFAAFGRVTKGMDVVRAINNIRKAKPTDYAYMKGQMLAEPVVIISIRRL